MRDLGSPVHSKAWFEQVVKAYSDTCIISVVYKENVAVGAWKSLPPSPNPIEFTVPKPSVPAAAPTGIVFPLEPSENVSVGFTIYPVPPLVIDDPVITPFFNEVESVALW